MIYIYININEIYNVIYISPFMLATCISGQDDAQTERSKAGLARCLFGRYEVSQSFLDACDGFLVSEKDSTPEELDSTIFSFIILYIYVQYMYVNITNHYTCTTNHYENLLRLGGGAHPRVLCSTACAAGHARWHRFAHLEGFICAGAAS